jgi:hypothetical protein
MGLDRGYALTCEINFFRQDDMNVEDGLSTRGERLEFT